LLREAQQETLKEKDKAIRQLKGERDSLFDELKTLQKNLGDGGSGIMSRTLSRKKLLSDQLSP